jgi:multiple sugar transport system substrate-binding protein
MKKIFLILCIFAGILLSGCTKKTSETVIKFSSWGSESEISALKPLISEFEKENPDIKVDFIHIPKNYFQKLQLLVASNLTPDVVFVNNINGALYAENNVFEDLSKYLNKDNSLNKKDFFPESLKAFTYKNQMYAIPRDISNLVVYYNKDIFNKYKVPYPSESWTFNDFLNICKKLSQDTDKNGKIDQFAVSFEEAPLFWLPYLWSNGGGFISRDLNSVIIDNPRSLEALQFYSDLRNKYHVAPTKSETGSATMAQLFMQRRIAMHISGRWSTTKYRKELDFRWDIARFPRGKEGSIVDCDTSGWAISKNSKHKAQAWRFISFMASKQSIKRFTGGGLIVPSRKDVANSNIFLDKNNPPENSQVFVDVISDSIPTPVTENYQEMTDVLNNALEPLWNGDKTAKQVINKDLMIKLNKLLK